VDCLHAIREELTAGTQIRGAGGQIVVQGSGGVQGASLQGLPAYTLLEPEMTFPQEIGFASPGGAMHLICLVVVM